MADLLKSKRLREERAPLIKKIQDMADLAVAEQRDFTAEEKPAWLQLNSDFDRMSNLIAISERSEFTAVEDLNAPEDRSKPTGGHKPEPGRGDVTHRQPDDDDDDDDESRSKGPTEEDRTLALQGWMLAQLDKPIQQRHANAAKVCGVNPHARHYDATFRTGSYSRIRAEYRALSTQQVTLGAATIPEGFVNNLERALLQFGGMRDVADVMRTAAGGNIPWPSVNDTSNEGSLVGENTTVTPLDPTMGGVVFHDYKYTSRLIQVPVELIEDSAFNLAAELGSMLGERIGRITNRHFTVGTGASQPWGIVPTATVGVTAASATAITSDELLNLVHSVDPAYRKGAMFMMSDSTLLALRKLKDGDGNYIWRPGMSSGMPDLLNGFPIVINQHMASIAASAKVIVFGQLGKYKIRDVAGFRLKRLVERFADSDQEGFLAFSRHDGNLLDAGTHPVQVLQMHS